jgi:polyisoprenyl-teichoic acid--peptidoglycan teichoic acid transferase
VSIPRDLGMDIPGYGWRKINHANAYGEAKKRNWGGAFATELVEDKFDIDIQYYIRIDFEAFKEIIDEVDGITVNVLQPFVDPLYPTPNGEYQTISFVSGEQTMDGETSLKYARSRHGSNGEGSDFARAHRQQKVLLALKEKILSFGTLSNPIRINSVINSLDKHITTNMEFSDIMAMLKLGRELDTDNITRLVLDNSPNGYLQNSFTDSGAFILEPKTGSFKEINHLIENIFEEELPVFDDTPIQSIPSYKPANIEIQNGTWRAGMAARMKKKLEGSGFRISTIGNTKERPLEQSGIYTVTSSEVTGILQGLVKELHIPIKETPPIDISPTSTTDVLIILGENFNE